MMSFLTKSWYSARSGGVCIRRIRAAGEFVGPRTDPGCPTSDIGALIAGLRRIPKITPV
jgi:hypothetical protein